MLLSIAEPHDVAAQPIGPPDAIATDQPVTPTPAPTESAAPNPFSAQSPTPSPSTNADQSFADLFGGGAQSGVDSDSPIARVARQSNFMIGDFFGRGSQNVTVGDFVGIAVHQDSDSMSAFAVDNIHLVTLQTGTNVATFVGGPAGLLPGSFLSPQIDADDLQPINRDLTLNSTPGTYTAVATEDTVDVVDTLGGTITIPDATIFNVFEAVMIDLPGPNVADLVGRIRLQDNNSAIPRNRVFFDYNFFHNVPLVREKIDVNRFAPGFEKTMWDGLASLEVRTPMAVTLNASQTIGQPTDTSNPEFGDIVLAPKILLSSGNQYAIACGMGVTLPTANDITVLNAGGDSLLRIDTESVHLIPYLAALFAPEDSSFFSQVFVTVDLDTNGNPVFARLDGNGLQQIGVWNDQTLIAASVSLGQFIYQDDSPSSRLNSLAYTVELHGTSAITDADQVLSSAFIVGDPLEDLSVLNSTIGAHARCGETVFTMGYSVPLTSSDRLFDGEFRCFINRFF